MNGKFLAGVLGRRARRGWALILALLAASLLLDACGLGRGAPLHILAGSELKDLQFLQPRMEKAVGRRLVFDYVGTLDMIDRLGAAPNTQYALAWAASNKYLSLALPGRAKAADKTMLSPVVLGVKRSTAQALGWDRQAPTWATIAAAVKAGKFAFAMTNPTASNSGFSAVVGVAAAFAGKGDGLQAADIDADRLREFFAGVKLTSGSSGWLADAYVREQARLDGLVNYESVILSLNQGGGLREPLVPVYPQEGIITADYPLMLLDDSQRAAYERLLAFVRRPEIQHEIMAQTFRRPVSPAVPPLPVFGSALLVELPFPGQRSVVDAILDAYLNDVRVPAHSYFLLDISGSMANGRRIDDLKAALAVLGGADTTTVSGRYARFQQREQVDLLAFDNAVEQEQHLDFAARPEIPANLQTYRGFVGNLQPSGGTAIYDTLRTAYMRALQDRRHAADYYYTIVLMTDGQNTAGTSFEDFQRWYRAQPAEIREIRVFPILFGEGDSDELQALAELTGGKLFNARQASLAAVFKEIRGYQ